MKTVAWALVGALTGLVFGLVWRIFEPSLGLYFWPALGALTFGQHAFRSTRRGGKAKPPTTKDAN